MKSNSITHDFNLNVSKDLSSWIFLQTKNFGLTTKSLRNKQKTSISSEMSGFE